MSAMATARRRPAQKQIGYDHAVGFVKHLPVLDQPYSEMAGSSSWPANNMVDARQGKDVLWQQVDPVCTVGKFNHNPAGKVPTGDGYPSKCNQYSSEFDSW